MNALTDDRQHLENVRRHQALSYAFDLARMSASALRAASCDEPNEHRHVVLDALHERLQLLIRELRQLT